MPFALLAGGALLMGALFLHLGSEIAEGETHGFDAFVLDAGRALRAAHPWFAEVMRDLSGLGSTVTLALVTLGACGYLAITRSWATAAIVAGAVVSGAVAVALFKAGFARVRPDAQFAQFVADGASYPSGHSSMAAVVYLTLGALIARMHRRRIEKAYILGAAASLALLVGISRAAMGVHWATDVAGGWALGIAWAAACMFTVRWADR
ncbi:MAG TPA: phosphatase PAP2 family protein [Casimicrobiaceae bacterium]|jgi:undecaprenyl-diphosphatase